jgi:phosphoserine phosphatase RsbU/P
MSIKWKITLSLIIVSLCLVSIYIFTATRVFESDKISYIFDEQQSKIQLQVQKFNQAIDSSIWFARLLFKDQIINEKKAEQEVLLKNQNFIDSIFVFDFSNKNATSFFQKRPEFKLEPDLIYNKINYKKTHVIHYKDDLFLASIPLRHEVNKVLLLIIKWDVDAASADNTQNFFFDNTNIIKKTGTDYITDSDATAVVKNFIASTNDISGTTTKVKIGGNSYLSSFAKTNHEGLNFVSLTDEEDALKALSELYNKSIVFLIISALVTFVVSLLLSNSLTYRINQLTELASEIGKGNFDIAFDEKSTDEVGILSQAFGKMGSEIKKLFADKIEKDRMERELKNAGIIQDKLFPIEKTKKFNKYNVTGHYLTSTECGGDWWHYFHNGDYLYLVIADATGHGTPAALVTSASNAVFSYLRNRDTNLEELVDVWDEVVYATSRGEVLMTAQICRIHLPTGKGEIINLGHEPPLLFVAQKKTGSFLPMSPNFSLGERKNASKKIQTFELAPGDHLLMYTDGVQASMFREKQEMSEKQILKLYNTFLQSEENKDQLTLSLYNFLRAKSDPIHQLEDDVTLVSVTREV